MALENAELPRELRKQAEALARDALAQPASARKAETIEPVERERLRALGYSD